MNYTELDFDPELDRLERLSNGVPELIQAGKLEEAERSCQTLKRDFPDQMDWMERTADVHEARGEIAQAIEHYEACIQFIRDHREDFDPESADWYRTKIERLRAGSG